MRVVSARTDSGGLTTRWTVETQRSLVQRISMSPMLTTKPFGMFGPSTQLPPRRRSAAPAIIGMCARPDLSGQGRHWLCRIEIEPHGADVTVDLVGEEVLGKLNRQRKCACGPVSPRPPC